MGRALCPATEAHQVLSAPGRWLGNRPSEVPRMLPRSAMGMAATTIQMSTASSPPF